MREPLQPFGFKESSYVRVEASWTCDCIAGPDAKGRCQANPPCVPQRSIRAKRGMLSVMVCMGTLGLLVMFLFGKQQGDFLSPGGLSPMHANLENGCASCHQAAGSAPETWLMAAFTNSARQEAETGCLGCHDFGEHAGDMFAPHGKSAAELLAIDTQAGELARSEVNPLGVQCTDCHREHQGAGTDLLALASSSCQKCHTGHTSFPDVHGAGSGLLARETRPAIVFDHDAHEERGNLGACKDCHWLKPDESGNMISSMLRGLSYRSNCAECHDVGKLEYGFDKGKPSGMAKLDDGSKLTYLRLPAFSDTIASEDESLTPRPWAAERGNSSLTLSSEAKILLGESYSTWIDLGNSKVSYRKFERREQAERKAPLQLLNSILVALAELGDKDFSVARASFARRVQASIGLQLDQPDLATLFPKELHAVFVQAKADWLDNPVQEPVAKEAEDGPIGRGFFAFDLEIAYVPRPLEGLGTIHADPVAKAWAPLLGRLAIMEELGNMKLEEATSLKALSSSFAGRCVKCHTVEAAGTELTSLQINWSPSDVENPETSLFVHAPHIGRKSCVVCHESAREKQMQFNSLTVTQGADMPLPLDPSLHKGSFKAIELVSCAQCHAPGKQVPNDCTTCHNFHPKRSAHFQLDLASIESADTE